MNFEPAFPGQAFFIFGGDMNFFKVVIVILLAGVIAACGGGGSSSVTTGSTPATNIGGGYTLIASGGTVTTSNALKGLSLLATLRDSNGNGPGLNGNWQITLTGPGISQPLKVNYTDGSPASYQLWRWEDISPASGAYTATASNGTVTISYKFTIDESSAIQRATPTKNGNTISWSPISGAGSYSYKVTDGTGRTVYSEFMDGATSSPSFQLPVLDDGSYLVEIYSYSQNFLSLMADVSAAPAVVAKANGSVGNLDFVLTGGVAGSYNLSAKGGTLYLGKDLAGVDRYGLAVWTSVLTASNTTPAGDWNITVTGPGISTPLSFKYPKTNSHYLYWEFGTTPLSGNYTVTATTTGQNKTTTFAIPDLAAKLPVASNVTITTNSNSYGISWNPVSGASSYYVNVWTTIDGIYTEVQGLWVNGSTNTVTIPKNSLTKGVAYDVYVTASSVDMTTVGTVPPPSPTQVNMSDNSYTAASFTAQ